MECAVSTLTTHPEITLEMVSELGKKPVWTVDHGKMVSGEWMGKNSSVVG